MDSHSSPHFAKRFGPWIFLVLAVGLFVLALKTQTAQPIKPAVSNSALTQPSKDELVNKHLQEVNQKIRMQQEMARINALKSLPQNRADVAPKPQWRRVEGVQQNLDRNELNAVQDLSRERIYTDSPDAMIQAEMVENEKNQQLEKAWREEYIRQYKQNAREAGYEIELDENLNIKSIKKRRPSNQ